MLEGREVGERVCVYFWLGRGKYQQAELAGGRVRGRGQIKERTRFCPVLAFSLEEDWILGGLGWSSAALGEGIR